MREIARDNTNSHVRSKFIEAISDGDPNSKQVQESKAKEGFEFCEKLFMLEREFAGTFLAERQAEREKQSRPILEELWTCCNSIDALRNSPLSKALGYATGQKQILGSFLLDGRIPISNNPDENAIRLFVMGRKNWLFCNRRMGQQPALWSTALWRQRKLTGWLHTNFLDMLASRNPQVQKTCRYQLYTNSIRSAVERMLLMLFVDSGISRYLEKMSDLCSKTVTGSSFLEMRNTIAGGFAS